MQLQMDIPVAELDIEVAVNSDAELDMDIPVVDIHSGVDPACLPEDLNPFR